MKTKLTLATIWIAFLVVLSGCISSEDYSTGPSGEGALGFQPGSDSLEGKTWALFAFRKSQPIPGSSFTLKFDSGQVSGYAGCNRFFGAYELAGNMISLGGIGMTEMACLEPEGIMEQEQYLLEFLGSIERLELEEDQLFLTRADGEALSFRAAQD